MTNITLTRTKNTVHAETWLPGAAYTDALAKANTHKGEIGQTDKGFFKATFKSVETAKKFVTEWTADYNAHKKADAPTPKSTPAKKPTTAKGKTKATASSTKKTTAPRKAKGNAFDYSVIKGETKKDKNKALHAMLVSKGIADSRTPEYQAIWNARPWAK